jgi:hypothetical protein
VKHRQITGEDAALLATVADHPFQKALDAFASYWDDDRNRFIAEAMVREFTKRTKKRDGITQAALRTLLWACNNRVVQAAPHLRHDAHRCPCLHCKFLRTMPRQKGWWDPQYLNRLKRMLNGKEKQK